MKVNVMELRDTGDLQTDKTLVQVDDETMITVIGFGTGEYKWKVHNCGQGNKEYDPKATIMDSPSPFSHEYEGVGDGFLPGNETLGPALVWAEPITFAHVVMDLINNQ